MNALRPLLPVLQPLILMALLIGLGCFIEPIQRFIQKRVAVMETWPAPAQQAVTFTLVLLGAQILGAVGDLIGYDTLSRLGRADVMPVVALITAWWRDQKKKADQLKPDAAIGAAMRASPMVSDASIENALEEAVRTGVVKKSRALSATKTLQAVPRARASRRIAAVQE